MASGLIPRRPGALPIEVTSFVGRRGELAQLARQLQTTRLATVTGPGGVGKTRVTLRTAAGYAGQFADGVCLAELAGLRDPELLPLTVASCLGLPDQETRSQLDAILDYLRKRQLLLILDGCEHLVDACAALATTLLRETAGVTVLATSRQPLDAVGEHICQIPPLPVPEPGSYDAGHEDAVELFAQRAGAVVPGFGQSGQLSEGRYWMAKALDRFPSPSPERAWALVQIGIVANLQGEIADALAALDEGIPMAEQLGETMAAGRGYSHRTLALAIAGRHAEAAAASAMAERLLEPIDDLGGLVGLDIFTSCLHLFAGEPDRTIKRCARGLARLPVHSRERWMQSWLNLFIGLGSLMLGSLMLGALERSADSVSRALEMKQELGDNVGTAWCLEVLAWTAAGQQRPRRAAWLLGAADPLWERAGIRLSGTAQMEELHQQAEKAVSGALGAEPYGTLHRRGAQSALEAVVKAAIGDEDELRVPKSPGRRAAESVLTGRQREIAALVAAGLSNKEIAERLVLSTRTVDSHVEHILAKLGASSRLQIAAWVRSTAP